MPILNKLDKDDAIFDVKAKKVWSALLFKKNKTICFKDI